MELEKVEEIRMGYESNRSFNKATGAGFIIAMGIVYGDIGTSPLYTQWNQLSKAKGGLSESQKRQLLGHFRSLSGR
ncbi:KUP/HAK/KT family potassium transporter [Lactococcus lactis]|uniref:KUP/HAK/KT family potassium transporter n=1 Tax=Lactococcus lactis TaxID=1358 RepID=UPI0033427916